VSYGVGVDVITCVSVAFVLYTNTVRH